MSLKFSIPILQGLPLAPTSGILSLKPCPLLYFTPISRSAYCDAQLPLENLKEYLPRLIPILLSNMAYADDDESLVEAEEDESLPDWEQDSRCGSGYYRKISFYVSQDGFDSEQRYDESFPVSVEALDSNFCLQIGKAKIEREGTDVTIVTFSKMVGYALKATDILAKEGIKAEVINLSTILPLDRATITASVRKTSRLVTVEEGFPQHGVGAEICASVVEESFNYLDPPVERIAGADVPTYATNLERLAVPQIEDIVRAAKRTYSRSA